mmetsp:Transcript_10478/g.29805  ORF Transcript_10478/g.29805 Transcript_10478/m.29805 type:complete len:313 (-) Transcript_10478:290-1228(-)
MAAFLQARIASSLAAGQPRLTHHDARSPARACCCCEGGGGKRARQGAPRRSRRSTLLLSFGAVATSLSVGRQEAQAGDTEDKSLEITDWVCLDIATCPEGFNQQRGMGESSLCSSPQALGRVVIGLYGNLVPVTVANFVKVVESGGYNGTLFHKILPGEYMQAGKQGPTRLGGVAVPPTLESNPEVTSASSFKLQHFYPGTVSLPLSVNDDDERVRLKPSYRNAEFLITTGPGPAAELDGGNIVFGRVVQGLGVVSSMAEVPTFFPKGTLQNFNALAKLVGDDRADRAKKSWGKPLQPVLIVSATVAQENPS